MIAHVSPADKHRDESRNTLVYADRAKNISNKVRKNVLDVSYHVSQYQNIITELKEEIGRLKEKIVESGNARSSSSAGGGKTSKRQAEELRELRDDIVSNFREQMKLRNQLMKIDTHILGLSMEFEKNNIIINEYEKEKAKGGRNNGGGRRRRNRGDGEANGEGGRGRGGRRGGAANANADDDDDGANNGGEADNEESGFEDESSVDNDSGDGRRAAAEEAMARRRSGSRERADSSDDEDRDDEPEEVRQAWDELLLIQKEQDRYAGIKLDLEQDLNETRKTSAKLEDVSG